MTAAGSASTLRIFRSETLIRVGPRQCLADGERKRTPRLHRPPTITGISELPATGDLNAGKTVALTLAFSEAVTVAGGSPTLTLNDGGTATYASGSGTSALTFNYTVAAGQNTASLAATAVNLPSGVTIKDSAGNAASLSLAGLTQSGPQIDTTAPASPAHRNRTATGDLTLRQDGRAHARFSEPVTMAGETGTLTAERRRNGDLRQRFGHDSLDLQLHRGRRTEYARPRRLCRAGRRSGVNDASGTPPICR